MQTASEKRLLGDYLLKEKLAEGPLITTWLAEQVSVGRLVLVDELDPQRASRSAAFLADIRAKAAVDHPLVGTVYQAVVERELCFYAHELLPGGTFEDRLNAGETFAPAQLAYFLRRIAEANLYHEAHHFATSQLTPQAIHLDDQGVVRLKNLVVNGPRYPEDTPRDLKRLGETMPALIANGEPGTTRMTTLLAWMRGEDGEAPLGWQEVRDFCEQVEEQLAAPVASSHLSVQLKDKARQKRILLIGGAVLLVALVAIAIAAFKVRPPDPGRPAALPLPPPVLIPAGLYTNQDGFAENLAAFKISAHEVTIGEYAEFLETLKILAASQRQKTFDAADQPPEKSSHEPDSWPALYAIARIGGLWQNRSVALDSPVVGVDWWDAMAYAEWKQARLPTQDEWFAALLKSMDSPNSLLPGNWLPVTEQTVDRTPSGLIGMAGSVSEWTLQPAPSPSNPLGESLYIIIGGSHLKPAGGALSREWVADRSIRRPDLGFRIVMPP